MPKTTVYPAFRTICVPKSTRFFLAVESGLGAITQASPQAYNFGQRGRGRSNLRLRFYRDRALSAVSRNNQKLYARCPRWFLSLRPPKNLLMCVLVTGGAGYISTLWSKSF